MTATPRFSSEISSHSLEIPLPHPPLASVPHSLEVWLSVTILPWVLLLVLVFGLLAAISWGGKIQSMESHSVTATPRFSSEVSSQSLEIPLPHAPGPQYDTVPHSLKVWLSVTVSTWVSLLVRVGLVFLSRYGPQEEPTGHSRRTPHSSVAGWLLFEVSRSWSPQVPHVPVSQVVFCVLRRESFLERTPTTDGVISLFWLISVDSHRKSSELIHPLVSRVLPAVNGGDAAEKEIMLRYSNSDRTSFSTPSKSFSIPSFRQAEAIAFFPRSNTESPFFIGGTFSCLSRDSSFR